MELNTGKSNAGCWWEGGEVEFNLQGLKSTPGLERRTKNQDSHETFLVILVPVGLNSTSRVEFKPSPPWNRFPENLSGTFGSGGWGGGAARLNSTSRG